MDSLRFDTLGHLMEDGVCVLCRYAKEGLSVREIWEALDGIIYTNMTAIQRHLQGLKRPQQLAREEAKKLVVEGKLSDRKIHEITGVSRTTLYRWKK